MGDSKNKGLVGEIVGYKVSELLFKSDENSFEEKFNERDEPTVGMELDEVDITAFGIVDGIELGEIGVTAVSILSGIGLREVDVTIGGILNGVELGGAVS